MGGVLVAIKQAEAFTEGAGCLSDVRDWWVAPIIGSSSLEFACADSCGAIRLEQGLIEATRAFRDHSELIRKYFRFACDCVLCRAPAPEFALPIWLDWINETAEALRLWHELSMSMPNRELTEEFRKSSWDEGLAHLRAGHARVANRTWREDSERILMAEATRTSNLLMAQEEFEHVVELAATLGLDRPTAPMAFANSQEVRRRVDQWWKDIGDPAIDRLFWLAHRDPLERAKSTWPNQLAEIEMKRVSGLLRTAAQGRRPKFNEVHQLSLTHIALFKQILSENGQKIDADPTLDGNYPPKKAEACLLDQISASALRRISRFLAFNPSVPMSESSSETRKLQSLSHDRQQQWLDTRRGEIWKEFARLGTPSFEYFENGRWDYENILAETLNYIGDEVTERNAELIELQILGSLWHNLPHNLPAELWRLTLRAVGDTLGVLGSEEEVKDHVEAQLSSQIYDPKLLNRKTTRFCCAVILSLISKDRLVIDSIAGSKPNRNVNDRNYVRIVPVVLELLRERMQFDIKECVA